MGYYKGDIVATCEIIVSWYIWHIVRMTLFSTGIAIDASF
jgi:hypothetical protein